jgi:selenocysteine lyase/cysteine desulfurase
MMIQKQIDISRARQETPGCEKVLHFNNAGAGLMPQPVLEAVCGHLQLEAEIGGYEAADQARDKVEHTYDAIAALIGCKREEIAVIENATRAWDMAFYSILFKNGDRILTAAAEYASNYIPFLQVAQKIGVKVEVIPNDDYGRVSIKALQKMMDKRVKLIAVTHVPTNGGLINPAKEIGRIARQANVLYLLDVCQSVGQMPINIEEIGCDMLSATGRKFLRGPRATGFLYVRRSVLEKLEPPFLDLHAAKWVSPDRFEIRPDARRFENWETYYAGKIGLGVAIDYALAWGLEAIWDRVLTVSSMLRNYLEEIPKVHIHDLGIQKCGIVSFAVEGMDPQEIRDRLREQKINVSYSPAEYTRIDMESRKLGSVVRASVHYYNTEEEVLRFREAIRGMA